MKTSTTSPWRGRTPAASTSTRCRRLAAHHRHLGRDPPPRPPRRDRPAPGRPPAKTNGRTPPVGDGLHPGGAQRLAVAGMRRGIHRRLSRQASWKASQPSGPSTPCRTISGLPVPPLSIYSCVEATSTIASVKCPTDVVIRASLPSSLQISVDDRWQRAPAATAAGFASRPGERTHQ